MSLTNKNPCPFFARTGIERNKNLADTTELQTLSVDEACQLLGVSKVVFYTRLRNSGLPSLKVGRRRRIPRFALERWMLESLENGKESRG